MSTIHYPMSVRHEMGNMDTGASNKSSSSSSYAYVNVGTVSMLTEMVRCWCLKYSDTEAYTGLNWNGKGCRVLFTCLEKKHIFGQGKLRECIREFFCLKNIFLVRENSGNVSGNFWLKKHIFGQGKLRDLFCLKCRLKRGVCCTSERRRQKAPRVAFACLPLLAPSRTGSLSVWRLTAWLCQTPRVSVHRQ